MHTLLNLAQFKDYFLCKNGKWKEKNVPFQKTVPLKYDMLEKSCHRQCLLVSGMCLVFPVSNIDYFSLSIWFFLMQKFLGSNLTDLKKYPLSHFSEFNFRICRMAIKKNPVHVSIWMLLALSSMHHIWKKQLAYFFAYVFDEPYFDWRRWSEMKWWKTGITEAEKWPRNLNFSNHSCVWI